MPSSLNATVLRSFFTHLATSDKVGSFAASPWVFSEAQSHTFWHLTAHEFPQANLCRPLRHLQSARRSIVKLSQGYGFIMNFFKKYNPQILKPKLEQGDMESFPCL